MKSTDMKNPRFLFRFLYCLGVAAAMTCPVLDGTSQEPRKKKSKPAAKKTPAALPGASIPGLPKLPGVVAPGQPSPSGIGLPNGKPPAGPPGLPGSPGNPFGSPPLVPGAAKASGPWEEYQLYAGSFSMYHTGRGGVGLGGGMLSQEFAPKVIDPRIREAVTILQKIQKYEAANQRMSMDELLGALEDARELAQRGIPLAAQGHTILVDPKSMHTFLEAAQGQADQERAAERNWIQSHYLRLRIWWGLHSLFEAKAGPAVKAPLFRVTVTEVPSLRMTAALEITNQSNKELHNVTFRLKTNLSRSLTAPINDYYLFRKAWKAGEAISFDRSTLGKLFQTPHRTGFGDAVILSAWCDEARQENVVYRFSKQKPLRIQNPGLSNLVSLNYRLVAVASK